MTRLNTSHSTKHKHIELLETHPKPTVKKDAEKKLKSKKPEISVQVCTNEDLLREIRLNRLEIIELKEEIVAMKANSANSEAKLQSIFELIEIN